MAPHKRAHSDATEEAVKKPRGTSQAPEGGFKSAEGGFYSAQHDIWSFPKEGEVVNRGVPCKGSYPPGTMWAHDSDGVFVRRLIVDGKRYVVRDDALISWPKLSRGGGQRLAKAARESTQVDAAQNTVDSSAGQKLSKEEVACCLEEITKGLQAIRSQYEYLRGLGKFHEDLEDALRTLEKAVEQAVNANKAN